MKNKLKSVILLVLLPLFLPLLQCTSNLIDRSLADYLMLENGKTWVFLDNEGDTVERTVVGDTVILGDSAKMVNFGGHVYIHRVKDQEVDIYSSYKTYWGGQEVELENNFILYLQIPFVNGNRWEDNYETSVEFLGDTFRYVHHLEGKVLSLEKVEVPAGRFEDVYKVKVLETHYLLGPYGEEGDTVIKFLYFAPDVGLIKRIIKVEGTEREYNLVSY